MTVRTAFLILVVASASLPAFAQTSGTPQEQAACRSDVRRYCSHVPRGADNMEYFKCLELNRDRLSRRCLAVLVEHGR